MTYYLMVFLLIGQAGWRIGDQLDGELFKPTPYVSLEKCMVDRSDRQKNVIKPNGVSQLHWVCVPDFDN